MSTTTAATAATAPRARRRNRLDTLPAPANTVLVDALSRLRDGGNHGHARRQSTIAVAFKPCHRGSDALVDRAIEFDAFRMFVLGHRFCDDDGVVRRRTPLAIYRPVVDLPGTGRIGFALEAVLDVAARVRTRSVRNLVAADNATAARMAILMADAIDDATPDSVAAAPALPEFYWAFKPGRLPVFEATHSQVEWASAEIRIGSMRAWPARMFVRGDRDDFDVNPVDGSPRPGGEHPSWVERDGVKLPRCQEPDAIYTNLAPFAGRTVRNPAARVLKAARIDPAGLPALAASSPESAADLMVALSDACTALGVPRPGTVEGYFEMLRNPAARVAVPAASSIQVVRLAGTPSPETLDFRGEAHAAGLHDLGGPYDAVAPRRVAEMMEQAAPSRRKPSWSPGGR